MLFGCANKVYRESAACTDPQSYDVGVHVYAYTKIAMNMLQPYP